MLTVIFFAALIFVAWKMLVWGLKAAWGIAKILCFVILLPLLLVGIFFVGLIYLAIPILVIVGIAAMIGAVTA